MHPKLLIAVMVDEPHGRDLRRRGRRARPSARSPRSRCRTCGSRRSEESRPTGAVLTRRREVLGDAAGDAPTSTSPRSPTTTALVTPGTLFFCVPGFTARRPRLRPRRRRARRGGARRPAPAGARRPRGPRRRRPRRDGARRRRAATATRPPRCDAVGITGTNGKTTTAFLVRGAAGGGRAARPGCWAPSTRSSAGGSARWCAPRPRRSTCRRTFADDARRRRPRRASWRSPPTRWRCTAPTRSTGPPPSFTNLTQDHLDFHADMEDYFLAKRRLFEAGPRRARSSTSTTPTARGWPTTSRTPITHRHRRARRQAARDRRCVAERRRAARPSRVDGLALRIAAARALQRPQRARRVAAARALGVDDATIAAALPRRRPRARPLRARRRGPALRGHRRLRPHARLAGERPARRPRAGGASGAADRRVRRRRRPRPRQAPADGRRGRRAGRRRRSSPPTTRATRTPRRSSPRSLEGAPARGAGRASTAARRSSAPSALAEPGDVVVIAGKGHEQGQEFAGGRKVPFDDVERRPGGAACATGRLSRSPRPPARGSSRRGRAAPRGPRAS